MIFFLLFSASHCLQITNLDVPQSYIIQRGDEPSEDLVLDCEFEMDEAKSKGFVLKWKHNSLQIYQWIPVTSKPVAFVSHFSPRCRWIHQINFLLRIPGVLQGSHRSGLPGVGRSVSEVPCLKVDQSGGKLYRQLQLLGADVRGEWNQDGTSAGHRAGGGFQPDVYAGEQRERGGVLWSERYLSKAGAGVVVSIPIWYLTSS